MDLLLEFNLAMYLTIMVLFTVSPFINRPSIQFGVRLPGEISGKSPFWTIRLQFSILNATLQIALLIVYFSLYSLLPLMGKALFPILIIPVGFALYFHARRRTVAIRGAYASNPGQNSKIVTFVAKENVQHIPLWFVLPWVELLIFILIGIWYYPNIPDIIPIHYEFNGVPNGFAVKSYMSVFKLLLLVNVPALALMETIAAAILRAYPVRNTNTPKKTNMQMRGFNSAMYKIFIVVALFLGITLFLNSAKEWGLLAGLPTYVSLIPVLSILPIILIFSIRVGQGGWKLYPGAYERPGTDMPESDDSEWAGGLIYHNDKDPSIIVPKRYGIGYTFNLGRKFSWILLGLILIFPALLLFHIFLHIL